MEHLLTEVLGKLEKWVIGESIVAAPGTSFLGGVALRSATSVSRSRRTSTILVFVLWVSPPGLLNSPLLFCPFALFSLAFGESNFFHKAILLLSYSFSRQQWMVKYFYDISGLTQANWETRLLVDIYVLKQWFTVKTWFLCVSPDICVILCNTSRVIWKGENCLVKGTTISSIISNNNRTYPGKLRNPVSRRYLCVKNNDLLSKPGFFA